jgi:hypothetical protein
MKTKNSLKSWLIVLFVLFLWILNDHFILPLYPWLGFVEKILFFSFLFIISTGGIVLLIYTFIKEKNNILKTFKACAVFILLIIFTIGMNVVFLKLLAEYIPDVPNLITSNYSTITGYPFNIETHSGKNPSQEFTINEIKFDANFSYNFPRVGIGKYKVTYLPHSKFILNIEKVNS